MLTFIALILAIYYYRLGFTSLVMYLFWNFVIAIRFSLPQSEFFEWFFVVLSIYLIGQLLLATFSNKDVTIERFLK